MIALTDHELNRLADDIRRAARHGQISFWGEDLTAVNKDGYTKLTLQQHNLGVVAEGQKPAYVEVILT